MRAPPPADRHPGDASPTALLRVRLFGDVASYVDGDGTTALEPGRVCSLLGYVLLHGDAPLPRQRLAFQLWPDSTEAQAMTNLRKVLHTLRREHPALERFLEVTPKTIRWRRDESQWVDVDAFEAALRRADDPDTASGDGAAALHAAVDLYRGDLLESCYDDWVVEARERTRDRYVSALRRLVALLGERGDHVEAIRLGRELARRDPLREDTYRLLMELHAAAGDRAGAVRTYHECAASLARELGVEPAAETRRAFAALTRSDAPRDHVPDPVRVSSSALVGRDAEWDRLVRCWHDAENGSPQLVLVTGEPGVGKTRLVEELSMRCAHGGAVVAWARAYATEGELGYGVAVSWLRAAPVAEQLRRLTPASATDLGRLLPELGAPLEPGTAALDETEQRRRLFDALAGALVADRPTLLVADDAQWCDVQSLQLIHYLIRLDRASRLLVVATVRREELDETHPLTALVSGLQIVQLTEEIRLERLTRAGTAALAQALSGDTLDAASVDALHDETEGNPLFIVESVRAGRRGEVRADAAASPKLQAVITTRLRQLSDPSRELLGVAATIGRDFSTDLLRAASDLDDLTLVRGLDELWRRGLIREQGTDAYDFSHGKIREAAYSATSPATRRRNHLHVAEALQRVHDGDLDAVSGQVAVNYDGAGLLDDAISWYRRAAVHAQRLHANPEAVRLLERARQLAASHPAATRHRHELDVLTAMATPLAEVEGFASDRLVGMQRRALELADDLGVDPAPPLLRSLAMSTLCRDEFEGARTFAGRLQSAARGAGDEGLLIESEYLLGIASFWGGELVRARTHFEHAVDWFREDERHEHLVRFGQDPKVVCLSRLANTLWFLGAADDARHVLDAAVRLACETGHPFSRDVTHVFAALLALDLEDHDRFREHASALLEQHVSGRPNEIKAVAFAGLAEVLDGRTGPGIERIRDAIDVCGPVNPAPGFRATLLRILVAGHALGGDVRGGLDAADEALRLGGSRLWEPEVRRLRAELLDASGAPSDAVDAELAVAADVAGAHGALGQQARIAETRSRLRSAR